MATHEIVGRINGRFGTLTTVPLLHLVDYEEALFLWRVDKKDFLLWTTTCVMTLFLGIEVGVLVGVGVLIGKSRICKLTLEQRTNNWERW
ncbi:hypothetical protein J5N97_004188 [Dioscorea zingiberensis]|uniref:Uncharacterized protein n=1 Tax=Dioscorea zingiberensis TaxID=325984 RepID=A0A9D5HRW0_9LILI|nr:hypothetical protein J5N97_004188 [Dioscorea zingiberensis]